MYVVSAAYEVCIAANEMCPTYIIDHLLLVAATSVHFRWDIDKWDIDTGIEIAQAFGLETPFWTCWPQILCLRIRVPIQTGFAAYEARFAVNLQLDALNVHFRFYINTWK